MKQFGKNIITSLLVLMMVFFFSACNLDSDQNNGHEPGNGYDPTIILPTGESVNGFFANGVIDNLYWGIVINERAAALTNVENLQKALNAAAEREIRNPILQNATYYLDGSGELNTRFRIPSNMRLNLNGSSFIQIANASIDYAVVTFDNAENSAIFNGKVIGDRYGHDYDTITSSHEWGYGIRVRHSRNIEIFDLEIFNMTGDGIYVQGAYSPDVPQIIFSQNITIRNNEIYNNRRQGITFVNGVDGAVIHDNFIHGINGGPRPLPLGPEAGICLEANYVYSETGEDTYTRTIRNVTIRNNRLEGALNTTLELRPALQITIGSHRIIVRNNEIAGNIRIGRGDKIIIENNIVTGGELPTDGINAHGKGYDSAFDVIIRNNVFENCLVALDRKDEFAIVDNTFSNSRVFLGNSSAVVLNNKFNTTIPLATAIEVRAWNSEDPDPIFNVYLWGNTISGEGFKQDILRGQHLNLSTHDNQADAENYYNSILTRF